MTRSVAPSHQEEMVASRTGPSTVVCSFESTKTHLTWYFAFFVISGFCGLVYEVVWVRLAMADFGVNTALVSIVLSIFMAGLGLGSLGARLVSRRAPGSSASALRLYAAAELIIGFSALAVPMELRLGRQLLLHVRGFGAWQSSGYYALAGGLLALALLPWCTSMGATFPLLMGVIRKTSVSQSKSSFSYLYVANVLGALLGTLASAFVLIELLGFRQTLLLTGALNAAIAMAALKLSAGLSSGDDGTIETTSQPGEALYGLPRPTSLLFLFTTGMTSMGMEVVWIRQFTPYVGTAVYAFAGILAAYLLGTLLGSQDYRRWARSHRPSASGATWTLLALSALVPLLTADPTLPLPVQRVAGIVLFCMLAGFLTPMLVDSWSEGDPDRAGAAYAANIGGCLVGPLVASFALLPALGERWSLVALSLPLFGIAGRLAFTKSATNPGLRIRPTLRFALALLLAMLMVGLSRDFEAAYPSRRVQRDYSATVIATGSGFDRKLLVNGVGMTVLTPITKYIAHLPLALLPSPPRNGLVICFGMGTTFRSMVSWGIPTTAVDLIPSVPAMFDYFHADAAAVEHAANARIVTDDGRRFLDGSGETFDVIVVDPPPPVQAAGTSLLYSRQFYDVIKAHLRRNGIFQSWYPEAQGDPGSTAAIAKALEQSFPYVRAYRSFEGSYGIHFLASQEPILIPLSSVLASRMPSRAAADFTEWGPAARPDKEFDLVLAREITLESLIDLHPGVPVLTDDRPVNEYYVLRDWFGLAR